MSAAATLMSLMSLLLLSACSSTTEAAVPAQESTVRYEMPDTTEVAKLPQCPLMGVLRSLYVSA